ncbi:hypothetical protein J2X31_003544 [Flavobacterium arsenatis]|uniref:HTTM domain-containing protein n=1 Tax=Flavobacterium arsenatis TaxID=1484332 RepID=A0ABU1TUF2_9FLAO|nr:hypothetical protein [Flavobacterium arsenatis]MDR6969511.1 hypothetical protein [Flavobacterium arsenatis]
MKRLGITVSYPKEVILIKIVCIAWLIAKVLSFKVWISDRYFPVVPVVDSLTLPNEFHLFLFFISLLGITSAFFYPNKKGILISVIVIEVASCVLDYMRWQPWEYQYLLTFVFFLFSKDRKQFLFLLTFLIAVTYIFSGIHKFSGSFLYSFWDRTILHNLLHLPYRIIKIPILHYSGLILAAIEIFIGVGILFSRHRRSISFLAILMHLFIVILYGPFGLNHNIIIFPWNLAMIALVMVLFYKNSLSNFTVSFFKSKLNSIVFLLIGVMPIFSLFGKWDDYLSFNLYSGNIKTLAICVEEVPEYPELEKYKSGVKSNRYCKDAYLINTTTWALEELKVPVYPQERVFKMLQDQFNIKYPNVKNTFVYYWYPYQNENLKEVR